MSLEPYLQATEFIDFKDNHPDADPDLMRLIVESGDILTASSVPVLDRWKKTL